MGTQKLEEGRTPISPWAAAKGSHQAGGLRRNGLVSPELICTTAKFASVEEPLVAELELC